MDNLQYLHNTLLEYNMLDKSFEEFQAASSDKSYQQKVFQETSNRGMFDGSFIDFQNKYFPTQAAVTTPTSTPTSTTTSTTTKPYVAPVVTNKEKSEKDLQIEQDAVNKGFWDGTGDDAPSGNVGNREDYSKTNGDWYFTNPNDANDVRKMNTGPVLNELQEEDIRIGQGLLNKGSSYFEEKRKWFKNTDELLESGGFYKTMGFDKEAKKQFLEDKWKNQDIYDEEKEEKLNITFEDKESARFLKEEVNYETTKKEWDKQYEEKYAKSNISKYGISGHVSRKLQAWNKYAEKDFSGYKEKIIKKYEDETKAEIAEIEEDYLSGKKIISDEEEAKILGLVKNEKGIYVDQYGTPGGLQGLKAPLLKKESMYSNFIEKHGDVTFSQKTWTKSSGAGRFYRYNETKINDLTKLETYGVSQGRGKYTRQSSTLISTTYTNSATGEELTNEERKEFDKFGYMKMWDDFVTEIIAKGGLKDDDKKLLYKNPELFKLNPITYRSGEKHKGEKVFDFGDVTTEVIDPITSTPEKKEGEWWTKATQYEDVPFYFYDVDEYKIEALHETLYEDNFGEYYLTDKGAKRYMKWHPHTPKEIIKEYEALKKRVDDNRNATYNEVTYHQGRGNRSGGVTDFISNEWDDKKQFNNWFNKNVKTKMYAVNGKEVFDAGFDGTNWNVKFADGTIYDNNRVIRKTFVNGIGVKSGNWNNNTNSTIYSLREAWKNTGTYKKLNKEWKERTVVLKEEEEKLKKEAKEFVKTKWNKYHVDSYAPSVVEYEKDNNISFALDFDKEVQEINAEAQAYFETESLPIQEEVAEELNEEFLNRYERNQDNKLVDRETGDIVTQEDINKAYENEFQKRFSSHPDIIRLKQENNALFQNTAEKHRDNWKPKRELISEDWYNEVNDMFTGLGFANKRPSEQRVILENTWDELEQQLTTSFMEDLDNDQNDLNDYLLQRKHEFFNYYYDPDKFNLAYNAKGEYSRFAIGQLAHLKLMLAEDKRLDAGRFDGSTNALVVGTVTAKANAEINDLKHLIETTDMTAEELDEFTEGFSSLRLEDWFVPAMLDKTISTYKIGKKMEKEGWEGLSEAEKSHMTILNLQGMIDGRNRELSSNWYGAGKLTAEMIPYVVEFVLTGGAFTAARSVALKGFTKLAVKSGLSVAKSAATKNAVKFSSWVVGTLAHTTANPQRYMNATFENMTPEMQLMLSDEGDELVGVISENGMGFEEAFLKGFGTTWAEFGTERLGEAIPMLGKYFKGKLPKGGQEFFERLLISKFMKKYGLTRSAAISKFTTEKMGWNGLIGEVFEETVNQPLSNIIMGNDVLEGMDKRFFSELSLSMGVTQAVFGGISLATMKKGRKTGYVINGTTYRNETTFLAKLKKMEEEGLFESNTKIDIVTNNDMDLANRIKKQYVDKYKNKRNSITNTETSVFDQVLASEIDITNELGENVDAYGNITTIEEETSELLEIKRDIKSDPTLSTEERKQKLKDINLRLKTLHQSKNQILAPIKNKIGKRKRLEAYKSTTAKIRRLIKKTGLNVELKEHQTLNSMKEGAKADLLRQVKENQKILDNYKGDKRKKEYKDLLTMQQSLQEDIKDDSKFVKEIDEVTHGYISRDGKTILINKSSALAKKGGNVNVAAHEFLHRAMRQMIGQNPAAQLALGRSLQKYVMNIDPSYYGSQYRNRLMKYQGEIERINNYYEAYDKALQAGDTKAAQQIAEDLNRIETNLTAQNSEEAMALLSDAFASGDMQMSNRRLSSLGKIFERIMSAFGVKATFAEGGDVYDFVASFNKSIEKDNFTRSMMNTLTKEADIKGELKEDVEGYGKALGRQSGVYKSKSGTIYRIDGKDINLSNLAKTQLSKGIGKTEQELGSAANTANIIAKNEKLQQEILDRYERGETSLDKNGKIIVPEDIQMELIDNNLPRVTALAAQAANAGKNIELEQDKKKGFDQFFPEYYIKLADLARTYNAEKVPFGAYMNTLLPLKYAGILEDLKKGEIEGAVGLEKAADVAVENENIERAGNLIKLYKRFGRYAEVYNLKVKEAIKDGKFNPAQENISRIGVNTVDVFPSMTQTMFGIIPKPGNLTEGDIQSAQMFINKNPETMVSMLPPTSYVVIKINPKTDKPSKIKSIGLPRKILNAFYTKGSKRIGNDFPWTRKKNISVKDMLTFAGITERTKPNLYKKDTNTSQSVIGMVETTGRMMTNQAAREHFLENNMPLENMGTLQESMSGALFSKGVNKGSLSDKARFFAGLPKFGENYKRHGRNVRKAFNMTYPPDIENPIFKGNRKAIIEDLERYIETYSEYVEEAILGQQPVLSLENYITEETMRLTLEKNLSDTIGIDLTGATRDVKKLTDARSAIALIVEEGYISVEEVKFLNFLAATGNIGGTTLIANEQGDLVYNEQHWQRKIDKAQGELNTAKEKKDQKRIKELEARIEGYRNNQKEGSIIESKQYGLFKGVGDLNTVVTENVKGTGQKIPPNTAQNVNVKLEREEDKQAQEDSSGRNKAFLRKFGKGLRELNKKGKISKTSMGMILNALGNVGMGTPIAAAARVAYTTDVSGKTISAATHRYEHLIPRKLVTLYYANSIMDGSAQSQLEFDNLLDQFVVAIIPKEQDEIVNKAKLRDSMPNSWFIGANALQRYFNMRTFGKINLKLIDVKTGKPVTGYENFNKVHEINGENHAKQVILNKAILARRVVAPAKGMSTFDFDETVAISDNYVIATREGETQRIPSEQWPFVGEQMKNEGWVMDFSNFNIVTEGKPGPLMQKLKNQIKKYGNENVFILTARAAESAPAIKAYLESEGVDLPIKNITGLGNSTGAAKAEWMLEKFSEGYNDMYFVDDALPNVEAVKNVLNQLDIKSNVQQARQQFSKGIKSEFKGIMNNAMLDMNRILEQTKGVKAEAVFSAAQAKVRGGKIGRYKIFLPPSAQDFKGLLYHFLGKGRVGEAQMAFFDKALTKPFAKAISEINSFKQVLNNKYKIALKEFGVDLKNTVGETNFTEEQAVRVYLWNKAGFEIPGLSKRDLKTLVDFVEANQNLQAFAETIGAASEQEAGYLEPSDYWMVENLQSDILKIANERKRSDFLGEWKQNVEIIFSPANLNKIEAIYGSNFREALEDILHRMEHGTSRESGKSRIVNQFNNWANQSVGAIMFFNMRSALLQTISSINFINWSDNNPLKAAIAFGNQPQFWKDFAMIFNSDMLKQRRAGNQRGINESELADAVAGSTNKARAALNWLLTKGFLPTQIADSFAIASGGATFYRNRLNTYLKQGYSQEEAHEMAFQDFQENSEESQQSSRPDMISQQQASPLGRYLLAFKNTPMQYARLIQKAMSDLKNGRGDAKTNMSKIVYYAMVQNFIFSALQTSLGMMIGTDDEEEEEDTNKYERLVNSMIDSLLGGLGIGGVAVSTFKNTIQEFLKQEGKDYNSDHAYTLLRFFGLSPTVGSKGRKLYSAIQTWKFNEDVIKEMSLLNIDNPVYSIVGNLVSAVANVPLDRVVKKVDNIDAAITEDLSALQRLALLMGWNTWDIDVEDSDVLAVEEEIKEKKDAENKVKKKKKKELKKKEKEEEEKTVEEGFIEDQKQEIKEGKKDITCVAVSKSGERCKTKVEGSNKYCTIHESVEQGTKEVQCKKIKSDKKRCGMKTKAKSGLCYYHD